MIRSKKMLNAAKDQSCVNCGARDGTIVAAHYQGMRSQLLGKGMGIKPHDLCIADLCVRCHAAFDAKDVNYNKSAVTSFDRSIDHSEQFLFLIMKTLIRRVEQGTITVDGVKREN